MFIGNDGVACMLLFVVVVLFGVTDVVVAVEYCVVIGV